MKFRPSKYQQIFSISWSSGFVYRLNFVMWRVRTVIQLLTVYLLWAAILQNNSNPAGYTAPELLTYIFLTSILRSVVFASRSMQVQSDIANGDLNNYLLKPLNIFSYWLSRDLADKLLNILFSLGEITLLYFLLKPPLVVPANSFYLITFILSVILGTFIYFYFSFIISTSVFWMPEGAGWPQRFLIFVLMEFLAGGIFPLDMLPPALYAFVLKLPFAYMLSIPLQIYLGRLSTEATIFSLFISLFWFIMLAFIARWLYRQGIKIYGAYGR